MIIDRKYTGFPEGRELNEMQELLVPYIEDSSYNLVVGSPTGSGKSTALTMFGHQHLENGKSVVYVGITKALVDEKLESVSEEGHPWAEYPMFTLTGDFVLDDAAVRELQKAKIIMATPESLLARLRNHTSDKSKFLDNIGLVVWDEIHLVAEESRGGNYEIAVAELASHYPEIQHVALSGTIPNANEFQAWFDNIGNKPCKLIVSDYRAVPVETKFVVYSPLSGKVNDVEAAKIVEIKKLVSSKPDEKWMICVFKKAFGKAIHKELQDAGYNFALHNADLDRTTRKDVERAIRNKSYDGVICTQTLMTGVNMPTPNLILTALEVAQKPVPVYTLHQAMGRAGRKGLDDAGYCYLLTNSGNYNFHKERLEQGERIVSTLHEPSILATHFLGAIHMGTIKHENDIEVWFERTFLYAQNKMLKVDDFNASDVRSKLLLHMRACGMIGSKDPNGWLTLTNRGKISVQQMVDPYHFADILKNFKTYLSLASPTDVDLAMAFSCCSAYRASYIGKDQKRNAPPELVGRCPDEYLAHASATYARLKGKDPLYYFTTANFQVWQDSMRIGEAVVRASKESEKWYEQDDSLLRALFVRIQMKLGMSEAILKSHKLTAKEAKKLVAEGYNTIEAVKDNKSEAAKILGKSSTSSRLADLGLLLGD